MNSYPRMTLQHRSGVYLRHRFSRTVVTSYLGAESRYNFFFWVNILLGYLLKKISARSTRARLLTRGTRAQICQFWSGIFFKQEKITTKSTIVGCRDRILCQKSVKSSSKWCSCSGESISGLKINQLSLIRELFLKKTNPKIKKFTFSKYQYFLKI